MASTVTLGFSAAIYKGFDFDVSSNEAVSIHGISFALPVSDDGQNMRSGVDLGIVHHTCCLYKVLGFGQQLYSNMQ